MAECKIGRYMLVDYCEDYGLVGYYETLDEMIDAASEWEADTDGECDLVFKEWYEPLGEYVEITVTAETAE